MSHLVYITLLGETEGVTLSRLGCSTMSMKYKLLVHKDIKQWPKSVSTSMIPHPHSMTFFLFELTRIIHGTIVTSRICFNSPCFLKGYIIIKVGHKYMGCLG